MSNTTVLPNPYTPLAFLDPKEAYQTSVSIYVLAGSAGVLVWDVLDNISLDYKLLFRNRISFTTITYFISRLGSLGYVISSNIFTTAPTGHCAAFETITDTFYPIALSASALLFFLRLRAIYNRDRLVVCFFFLLWLSLVGTTLIIPIVTLGTNIGPTQYCIDADVPDITYAGLISPLVHDTLVFLAISWRLASNGHANSNFKDGVKSAIFGNYLPSFTRGLLKDGQRYYLISLISNLVTVILIFDTSIPIPMRSMCATPNIVLINIMACRVYRNTRFGGIRELEISTTTLDPREPPRLPLFPIFARSHGKATSFDNRHPPLSNIANKLQESDEDKLTEKEASRPFVDDVESQIVQRRV